MPIVFSPLTNWNPEPMMKLKDFCSRIDKSKPDFFSELKGEVPPKIAAARKDEESLNE